jgi:hypothetical protein
VHNTQPPYPPVLHGISVYRQATSEVHAWTMPQRRPPARSLPVADLLGRFLPAVTDIHMCAHLAVLARTRDSWYIGIIAARSARNALRLVYAVPNIFICCDDILSCNAASSSIIPTKCSPYHVYQMQCSVQHFVFGITVARSTSGRQAGSVLMYSTQLRAVHVTHACCTM